MRCLAHGLRAVAIEYPVTFPLVTSRFPAAPWMRPPLHSLRWINDVLADLAEAGFTKVHAVDAYRAFTSLLLGHLLLEVAAKGAELGPLPEPGPEALPAPINRTGFAVVDEPRLELAQDYFKREFEESLENFLDRIELPRQQR